MRIFAFLHLNETGRLARAAARSYGEGIFRHRIACPERRLLYSSVAERGMEITHHAWAHGFGAIGESAHRRQVDPFQFLAADPRTEQPEREVWLPAQRAMHI